MRDRRIKVYINGRGFADIAKSVIEKMINNAQIQTLVKSASTKAAEVAGDKIGSYAANNIAEKVLPQKPSDISIKAIEDLEKKIKQDIGNYTGKGFKLIW